VWLPENECVLAGGPRSGHHSDRKVAVAEAAEKERTKEVIRLRSTVLNDKKSEAAFLALVTRVRKKITKPLLTKSVREKATKKQIASWTKVS
jgi:hypothetical protein